MSNRPSHKRRRKTPPTPTPKTRQGVPLVGERRQVDAASLFTGRSMGAQAEDAAQRDAERGGTR